MLYGTPEHAHRRLAFVFHVMVDSQSSVSFTGGSGVGALVPFGCAPRYHTPLFSL